MKILLKKKVKETASSESSHGLSSVVAKAPHIQKELLSASFSEFSDGFALPRSLSKVSVSELGDLMAKIVSFQSFLLARVSVMRVDLDNAQKRFKRAKAIKNSRSDLPDSRKWKLDAVCDTDKELCSLQDAADNLHHAVTITESWCEGLTNKLTVLSREITLRGLDAQAHGMRR